MVQREAENPRTVISRRVHDGARVADAKHIKQILGRQETRGEMELEATTQRSPESPFWFSDIGLHI